MTNEEPDIGATEASPGTPQDAAAGLHGSGLGREFWLMWSAATTSFVGDGIMIGALPLLALSLTQDPRLIGGLNAASMVGWLLLGLVAGVIVDRTDRLRLMWRIDIGRAVLMMTLAGAVAAGVLTMPALLAIAVTMSLLAPFFDNASSSVVPEIVPPSLLERANSWTQTPMLLATSLLGPPLGSLLFTSRHLAPFVLNGVSFLTSALILQRLVTRRRPRLAPHTAEETSSGQRISPRQMLTDGLAYLVRQPALRGLALAVGLINTLTGGLIAMLALYVTEALHQPAGTYGWLLSAFAVGGVITGPLAPRITTRVGRRATVLGAQATFCLVPVILGAAPRLGVAIVGMVLIGAASILWNVTTISFRQRVVPAPMLGRVNGAYLVISYAGIPIGSLAGGLMTAHLGVAATYLTGGLGVAALSLGTVPALLDLPRHQDQAQP